MRDDDDLPETEERIPATLRSITPEDIARATLHGALAQLGRAEAHALTRIAERLTTTGRASRALAAITRARSLLSEDARRGIDEVFVALASTWIKSETLKVTQ